MPTKQGRRRLVQKSQRMFFVLPPAVLIPTLRRNIRTLRDKLIRRNPKETKSVPPVHPFDRQYGIDTGGYIGFGQLQSGKSSDVYNACYGGSRPSIIRKALQMLPDHRSFTFFDLGCGKGRALIVASEFPFRRIVGVELVPFLASTANTNAEIIRRRFPERTPIEVVEGDA